MVNLLLQVKPQGHQYIKVIANLGIELLFFFGYKFTCKFHKQRCLMLLFLGAKSSCFMPFSVSDSVLALHYNSFYLR